MKDKYQCYFCDSEIEPVWFLTEAQVMSERISAVTFNGVAFSACDKCKAYFTIFVDRLIADMKKTHGPLSKTKPSKKQS